MKRVRSVRQRDATDCGAACLAAVCAYHGLNIPVAAVRMYAGTGRSGTTFLGLQAAATQLGMEARGVRTDYERLSTITVPAIVHMCGDGFTGHFCVLEKITRRGPVIMDPATGRRECIARDRFINQWSGALMILSPGESFTTVPRKPVLTGLLKLAWYCRDGLLTSIGAAVGVSCMGLALPVMLRRIVDDVLPGRDHSLLGFITTCVAAVILTQVMLAFVKDLLAVRCVRATDRRLVHEYYRHLFALPQRFFDTMQAGEIVSRTNDAVRIGAFIGETITGCVLNFLVLLCSVLLTAAYHGKLVGVIILVLPVYALIYYISDRFNAKWERKVAAAAASLDANLTESVMLAGTVRKLGMEEAVIARGSARLDVLLKTAYTNASGQIGFQQLTDLTGKTLVIGALWLGTTLVLDQGLSQGQLLSFYALLGYFTGAAIQLLGSGRQVREAMVAYTRLFEIMQLHPEPGGKAEPGASLESDIVFRDVSFAHEPGTPVLDSLNIRIPKGMVTGITGDSGTGKSTLAALIQRIYLPSSGSITLNGIDIATAPARAIRNLITAVPQQPQLFSGSILENITAFDPQPDIGRVMDVSEHAGVTDFLPGMPLGVATLINEHGSNLSGGQRQKICIARALYSFAPVIILDEPTSSLDDRSKQQFMRTIESCRSEERTIILITHDTALLDICDQVISLARRDTSLA